MFRNVGRTIQILAKVLFGVGVSLSVLSFLVCLFKCAEYSEGLFMVIGIASLLFGTLVSWINSILLFGFGNLIENNETIKNKLCGDEYDDWYEYDEDQPANNDQYYTHNNAQYIYNDVSEKPTQTTTTPVSDSISDVIYFLNKKYNVHIELSDDLYMIKEKLLNIDAVDNSTQIFKNRISDARSLDEAMSIIKMHCTINK